MVSQKLDEVYTNTTNSGSILANPDELTAQHICYYKQWCSEGGVWPGTCPAKALCSSRSRRAISQETRANGLVYSRCLANTNDLATPLITKQLTEVLATLELHYPWKNPLGSPQDLVCQSPIPLQYPELCDELADFV